MQLKRLVGVKVAKMLEFWPFFSLRENNLERQGEEVML